MVRNLLLATATSVLLLSGCVGSGTSSGAGTADSSATTNSQEDKEERNKKTVMASMEAMTKGDVDAMLKDAAPDAVDYNDGSMPPMKISDSLKGMIKQFMTAFPDYKVNNAEYFADGNKVLVYYECSGTWKNDMMGMKATGKPFTQRDVEIFTFNDEGKVTEHRSVQSMGTMMAQIGAVPPPPEK
ncbi:MAG TPA: ester cyclase [Flavipsychrobacter sp.]|nr:ester cyclase [Flavipsychrobacter sp.]